MPIRLQVACCNECLAMEEQKNSQLETFSSSENKPSRKRTGIWSWCKRVFWAYVCLHALIAVMLLYGRYFPVPTSAFMVRHALTQSAPVQYIWVENQAIARTVKQAAIASEDANFATHKGFEWDSIERAFRKNERSGEIKSGGSTISQQLAKNLFLFAERSYIRKAEEAVLTVMIEAMWPKERILTVYLNVAEFGNGIYGIEAAARHYYRTGAANLNANQAASLIAMLPRPKYYQQNRNSRSLAVRTRIIQRRMGSAVLP